MDYEVMVDLKNLKEELENIIMNNLPDEADECRCKESEKIDIVHRGNHFHEIISYCLKCGGVKCL